MLELRDISLFVGRGDAVHPILADVDVKIPSKHFTAIIGPSGCGKSTLLKTVAGIVEGEEEGDIFWEGRNLSKEDFAPCEIGYVPQFSIAHDELTVGESVSSSVRLRLRGLRGEALDTLVENTLAEVGMLELINRRVSVLSGGQKRRLALAMEIASAPRILLCDEVTSGLDAQSETEIVHLLHALSQRDRLVLSVTHSLRHLELYDSILVLFEGVVAYHGTPQHMAHYFRVDDLELLYARLEERTAAEWAKSWRKYAHAYAVEIPSDTSLSPEVEVPGDEQDEVEWQEAIRSDFADADAVAHDAAMLHPDDVGDTRPSADLVDETNKDVEPKTSKLPQAGDLGDGPTYEAEIVTENIEETTEPAAESLAPDRTQLPGFISQWLVLLERRFLIFWRSKGQLFLQIGLVLGFPVLVAIFAWNGLPQIQNLTLGLDQDVIRQLAEASEFLKQASKVGSLVSGIVMFQVILLTLMGANNSGREIAAERLIFEKEKLSGLRPASYIASKAAFLFVLVVAQSLWMGLFVHFVCGFPGDLAAQLLFLFLVNAAMTSICLGISAWMASAEQASLVSIYLVGFQLPLSGAVLALPDWIGFTVRPFISAYWSWSGVLQTLRGERYYDIVQMVVQTALSPAALCLWVLLGHVVFGLVAAWAGCRASRMR